MHGIGEIDVKIGLAELEGIHVRGGDRRVSRLAVGAAVEYLRADFHRAEIVLGENVGEERGHIVVPRGRRRAELVGEPFAAGTEHAADREIVGSSECVVERVQRR